MHRSFVRYLVLYLPTSSLAASVLLHCYEFLAIDQPATSAVLCVQVHGIILYYLLFCRTILRSFFATFAEVNSTKIISHDKNMRIKSIK